MEAFFGFRNFRQFERTRREIKLPYDLLNDIRFRQLPDAQKAHLICLLLLSARMNNLLPNSSVKLEQLIGATEPLDLSADPQWRQAALRYREVRLRLESAAFEEHRLHAILTRMATARRTYGCGVEVLKSSRRGAVDYSAVPELRGVNLEPYRKPPVAVVKINFIEPNQQ